MKFLVIEGTVRRGRMSVHAARKVCELLDERGHDAELFDLKQRDVPMLETRRYKDPGTPPDDVEEFGQLVEESDSLVIVSPEYNHTFPGALKNLLDYLYPEYEDKPFSYVTVSGGGFGGVRALEDLESLTLTLKGHPGPSLPVSGVNSVFNGDGELVDGDYEQRFQDFVDRAVEHAEEFS